MNGAAAASLLRAGAVLAATTPAQRAELILFVVLAPVSVLTALGMVLNRRAVYSALLLVVNFFCLAAFYVLLQAQFLAAVQVIVYAGAIMVLFLFVVMLPASSGRSSPTRSAVAASTSPGSPATTTCGRSASSCSPATCSRSRRPACFWWSRRSAPWCSASGGGHEGRGPGRGRGRGRGP